MKIPMSAVSSTDATRLAELIEKAKSHVMTPEEKAAQRKSWVIGQFMLSHPGVTREYAEAVYEKVINE